MRTRRETVGLISAGLLVSSIGRAWAQAASVEDLAEPGPLGDVPLGASDAKVTIYEYASLTCGHCAVFHQSTFPELRRRYVGAGKVRFILREFPLDPLATAGFMLARADNSLRFHAVVDLLFEHQRAWAYAEKPLDALQQLMRQAGFSQEKFEATLRDQTLYAGVNAVKARASAKFKINSTPTFFINGRRHQGSLSVDDLDKALAPHLAG